MRLESQQANYYTATTGVKFMTSRQERKSGDDQSRKEDAQDETRNNQENELEAEEESAAAMGADVPQPPDASDTTEGQPS